MTAAATPLLAVRGLRKDFGALAVLKGIDLDVGRSEVVGFIGASGSGKSTLLRCINFLETPSAGEIVLDGEPVGFAARHGAGPRRLQPQRAIAAHRGRMSMVFQHFHLWPHKTVLENVIEGPVVVKGVPRQQAEEEGRALLAKVGLAEKAAQYPRRLSGGQQQRVAIARALALKPKVMLLDEPTSALDPELVGEVLNVIKALASEGMTMLIVTHEIAFARDVCDRMMFVEGGRIADSGPPAYICGPDASPRTLAFLRRFREG